MRHFTFVTTEGITFQPDSENIEPDVENAQVLGFEDGVNEGDAFQNLLKNNSWVVESNFNEVVIYELKNKKIAGYGYVKDAESKNIN